MASDEGTDEVFDEEELADGFDEEIIGAEEELDDADVEGDDVMALEEVVVEVAVPEEEEDVADDVDVELALDEVLAETIRRATTPEDDDEVAVDIDPTADPSETILPKQDDEFRCKSCRLLKKTSQLANLAKSLCRDCV